jgi:hypothetical protein
MYGELPLIKTSGGSEVPGFPVRIDNPVKTAVLRLPTGPELSAYLAAQFSLVRPRSGVEDQPTPRADAALFDACRIDADGVPFDEAEIEYALSKVLQHSVTECERDGQTYTVALVTPFGDVSHTVEIPTRKQMAQYRREVIRRKPARNGGGEEYRFPPDVPGKLYDKLIRVWTGYLTAELECVPPHHKRTVIAELMTALNDLDSASATIGLDGDDPNSPE